MGAVSLGCFMEFFNSLKSQTFLSNCFVGTAPTKQFAQTTKPFPALNAELTKRSMLNQRHHSGARPEAAGSIVSPALVVAANEK